MLTLSVVAGLFPKPYAAFLLAASILCFLMGAVASALAMRNIVHDLDEADDRLHRSKAQLFAWSTLYSGLAIFAVFALINFIKR